MIPKTIWTIWLGNDMPEHVIKCVTTHTLDGYEHILIDDSNFFEWPLYAQECFQAGKFAKAADYLRIFYLEREGGIYLDADVTVLKPFDDLLYNSMFVGAEKNGFISNAVIGSEAHHPILKEYLREVETNFIGSGDLIFQPGMYLWTELVNYKPLGSVQIYPSDYFLPYDHRSGDIEMTNNTHTFHHFNKSWMKEDDVLPTVSILIPTLNRPEGLQRCLDSIDRLLYPKHLIEVLIDDRKEETVPQKVDHMYHLSRGKVIVYAADDMEFNPLAIYGAARASKYFGLVSFNAGPVLPDEGNICEHFLIRRDLIPRIGGQIFDTDFYHVGVDNLLWAKAKKLGEEYHSDGAVIIHHHFSKTGEDMDSTYQKAWKKERVDHDRALLARKLGELTSS